MSTVTIIAFNIYFFVAFALLFGGLRLANYTSIRRVHTLANCGRYKEAVDRLYSIIWTGTKEDECPAWERVINYLETHGFGEEMQTEAKLRWLCQLYQSHNCRYSEKQEATV